MNVGSNLSALYKTKKRTKQGDQKKMKKLLLVILLVSSVITIVSAQTSSYFGQVLNLERIFPLTSTGVREQTVTVSGTVISSDTNSGLPGASVTLVGEDETFGPATTAENGSFTIADVTSGTTYTINITAPLHTPYSETLVVDTEDKHLDPIMLRENANPARGVTATLINSAAVEIKWVQPFMPSANDIPFSHASDEINLGAQIGAGANNTFGIFHRFSEEHLIDFGVAGANLTHIDFVPNGEATSGTWKIRVYTGGTTVATAGTLVHEQNIPDPTIYQVWTRIALDTPIPIPVTGEFRIGVVCDQVNGQLPFVQDFGPRVHQYGNIIGMGIVSFNFQAPSGIANNMLIRGIAGTPRGPVIMGHQDQNASLDPQLRSGGSRSLQGYNIYRTTVENLEHPQLWMPLATNLQHVQGQETYTYIDHTWSTTTDWEKYLWIVQAAYSNNNLSDHAVSGQIMKIPDNKVYIGNQNSTTTSATHPINYSFFKSMSQTIYLESEISLRGAITELTWIFTRDSSSPASQYAPVQIYFSTTTEQSSYANTQPASWVPLADSDYILVWDDPLDLLDTGVNTFFTIPLITPFDYQGGNLVVTVVKNYYAVQGGNNVFLQTPIASGSSNRSIQYRISSGDDLDPFNFTVNATATSANNPNILLTFSEQGLGTLTGLVTSADAPVEGVAIALTGTGRMAYSNSAGQYLLPYILPNTYNITASKVGYEVVTINALPILPNVPTTQNFSLSPSASVTVTGRVLTSDTEAPIAGASVILTGYATIGPVTTDAQGLFTINNVFAYQSYVINTSVAEYNPGTFPITVEASDFDAGDVYVYETAIPPVSLVVTEVDYDQVLLTWIAPDADLAEWDSSRALQSYDIYRSKAEDIETPDLWVTIATDIPHLTGQDHYTYTDETWGIGIEWTSYRWIVRSVWSHNNPSVHTVSNELVKTPVGTVQIGDQRSTLTSYRAPVNYYYVKSMSQSIYLDAEIPHGGWVESLTWRFTREANEIPDDLEVQIYLANTPQDSFPSRTSWVPLDQFTLVYNAPLPVQAPGTNLVTIQLPEPFISDGGNLAVMAVKNAPNRQGPNNVWQHTPLSGDERTISVQTDTAGITYDPEDYPLADITLVSIPNIMIQFNTADMGHLAGTITTGDPAVPLADAEIRLTNMNRAVRTNALGEYKFNYLPVGVAEFTVTKQGYISQTIEVEILLDELVTKDLTLMPLPTVTVDGTILASDTGAGLQGVTVTLKGYEDYETTTNAQGLFTFNGVYANLTYHFEAQKELYFSHEVENLMVGNTPLTIPPITMQEIPYPPRNVFGVADGDNLKLTWIEPTPGFDLKFSHSTGVATQGSALGISTGGWYETGHRYTVAQLAAFGVSGALLTEIEFVPNEYTARWSVLVYTGNIGDQPENLVLEQVVPNVTLREWNTVVLTEPVQIPHYGELWLTFRSVHTAGQYPHSVDDGPSVLGYGNLRRFQGVDFAPQTALDVNWLIRGKAEGALGPRVIGMANEDGRKQYAVTNSVVADRQWQSEIAATGKDTFLAINNALDVVAPIGKALMLSDQTGRLNATPRGNNPMITANTRVLTGYNIYRTTEQNLEDESLWETIETNTPGTPLGNRIIEYIDTNWQQVPPGFYYYLVRAVYTHGYTSTASVSNQINHGALATVKIKLHTSDEEPASGAQIRLYNLYQNYPATAAGYEAELEEIPWGNYALEVRLTGYQEYHLSSLVISSELLELDVALLKADYLIDEGFDGMTFPPAGWTRYTSLNHPSINIIEWHRNTDAFNNVPPIGAAQAVSRSWITTGGFTPNNWMMTPQLILPDESQTTLTFMTRPEVSSQGTFGADKLTVYVSTTGNQHTDFQDVVFNYVFPVPYLFESPYWQEIVIDLSEYAGQNIYLAFRHWDCYDESAVIIDEVKVMNFVPALWPPRNLDAEVVFHSPEDETADVNLTWDAPVEGSPTGYRISRVPSAAGFPAYVNALIFTDVGVSQRVYTYSIVAMYGDEESLPLSLQVDVNKTDEVDQTIVARTELRANYPNPFNPTTTIAFDIKEAGNVKIEIFNIRGQKVKTLVDEYYRSGRYTIHWNGTDERGRPSASGVYFYRMRTAGYYQIKRMLLLK